MQARRKSPVGTGDEGRRTSWDVLASTRVRGVCACCRGCYWAGVGVRPHEVHRGPRCQNASDGAAVKGAASAVREAQAEGPTLTGATPMRPSWRVREGLLAIGAGGVEASLMNGVLMIVSPDL
jgi:hypothetical protein